MNVVLVISPSSSVVAILSCRLYRLSDLTLVRDNALEARQGEGSGSGSGSGDVALLTAVNSSSACEG
jgi:hypothetical protein